MKLNQIACAVIYLSIAWLMASDLGKAIPIYISALFCAFELNRYFYKKNISNSIINGCAIVGIVILLSLVGIKNSVSFFVSMMLLASILKIYQAQNDRKTMQVFVLNFFTIPCLFIFSQNVIATLLVFIFLGFNLTLMLMHQYEFRLKDAIKNAFSKLFLTIPLSILLVLFIPKLPAFWQLPGPNSAKTGLSENVDPFEISKLSESNELVFRAVLATNNSTKAPFYWRALVHDQFDGKKWNLSRLQSLKETFPPLNQQVKYSIIAEPSHHKWLYALDKMTSIQKLVETNVFGLPYRKRPVSSAFEYQVLEVETTPEKQLARWQRRQNIQIPSNINPKSKALAKKLYSQSRNTSEFIDKLKNYIINQGFTYTLSPPISQTNNRIDEFLFDNKAGFCGHYASSIAMMLRSVGIPARLVSGYLGGEYNQQNDYYNIYQYDAHAWLEYHSPNFGWIELDPTAWVSPERLNGSLSQHSELSQEFKENIGITLMGLSNFPMINWLRLTLEAFDYQWTRWVLNFDEQKQSNFLSKVFGTDAKVRSGIAVVVGLSLIFALTYWALLFYSNKPLPKSVKLFKKIQKKALNEIDDKQTPGKIINQIQQKYPSIEIPLHQFLIEFEQIRYGNKKSIKKLRRQYIDLEKAIKKQKRD